MIKRALISIGMAIVFSGFMIACVLVNLALQGNLDLDVLNLGPTSL